MGSFHVALITMLLCMLIVLATVDCQGNKIQLKENGQINKDTKEVKDLLKKNNLKEGVSFRCGIFFAGKDLKDKPFQKLFIIPKRFPINQTYSNPDKEAPKVYSNDACPIAEPYGTVDKPSVHNDTCYNIFVNVVDKLKLEHDSFENEGKSIGDDICKRTVKLDIKRLPPNRRFKKGIPIGFYFSVCSDKAWYDTSLRLRQKLCCDPETGKANPTYKSCEEFDDDGKLTKA